jgi:hypothetical protein
MKLETLPIKKLTPDRKNARKHDDENLRILAQSLEKFGQRKPIVITEANEVVAGNGTLEAAKKLGWLEIEVVRVPNDWSSEMVRAFAIADNRTAELSEWNTEELNAQLLELEGSGWQLEDFGFVAVESAEAQKNNQEENAYNQSVKIPQYEIVGEKPGLLELVDNSKTLSLQKQVEKTNLPEDVKEFLKLAAYRHTVFDYRKIAEFYAYMPAEIQKLFEDSALVIIDLQDAIANGFTNFTNTIAELRREDSNEDE